MISCALNTHRGASECNTCNHRLRNKSNHFICSAFCCPRRRAKGAQLLLLAATSINLYLAPCLISIPPKVQSPGPTLQSFTLTSRDLALPTMLGPIPKAQALHDPLDEVLKPPPDETPLERQFREARQEEAKRVSNAIDDAIKAERQMRKKKRIIRLLLLGQSESGASLLYLETLQYSWDWAIC